MPTWEGGCGFKHSVTTDYNDCQSSTKFRIQELTMFAGIGTHMDAPSHINPGSPCISDIPLQQLITRCCVIDVSLECHESLKIDTSHLRAFEARHGLIPKNSFVIFYTGWEKYWPNAEAYVNQYSFPSLSEALASLLIERDIAGIGIDTLSPDLPSNRFPVHEIILGANKYIIENVANANKLPPIGAYSFALPMHFVNGTEATTRLIALVPKS